ncbi:MAG: SurA N-terminal domain-containing protein [Desulfobulbaceae bacterium]|nr:SurA N-terminal domain-containing protein [Desulfobulbaceae bacterium]
MIVPNKRFSLIALVTAMAWFSLLSSALATDSTNRNDETMGHGSAKDIVVAKVNGAVINMDQLMRTMSYISRTKHGSEEVSPLLAEKIKQEAIDQLVIEELAVQAAHAKIKNIPPEQIEAKIDAIKKSYKSEEAFQEYIKNEFGDMDGLKKQLQRSMPLELFISQEFGTKVKVSDQEVEDTYNERKSRLYVTNEFVQVNDLLFFLEPSSPESVPTIEKIKQSIIDKYDNNPRNFPSDSTFTLQKNMPLDKIKDKALYEAARGLKEYGWSAPINVDGNLHIVQLIGYKPAQNKSLQEVAPLLKQQINQEKLQAMLATWLAGIKEGAKIEIVDLTR